MIRLEIEINRPLEIVWDFFMTLENWEKWIGRKPEVNPAWQIGATAYMKPNTKALLDDSNVSYAR